MQKFSKNLYLSKNAITHSSESIAQENHIGYSFISYALNIKNWLNNKETLSLLPSFKICNHPFSK